MVGSGSRARAVTTFTKSAMSKADISHRYDHACCVVKLCKKIGVREGADIELVTLAGYLHDVIPRGLRGDPHHIASARKAERLLLSVGLSRERSRRVREIIEESSYEAALEGRRPSSLEAEVLMDSDFLEAMGARGIARAFAFAGWHRSRSLGELNWDPKKPPSLRMSTTGPDPSPVWHFASKLLRLRDMMCTKTGKRMAKRRHDFMVQFLQRYKMEFEARQ